MAEMDIIKLEQELKKTRVKRLIKNKNSALSLAVLTASIPCIFLNEIDILRSLSAFMTGLEIQILTREWKKLVIPEEKIILEFLKKTETFKTCQEEYDKYITEVAKLIKNTGLTSSKEIIAYLHLLLTSGHFSKNFNHKYKIFAHEKMELVEICGARVLTGKSVCRHQSSFLVDVLNKLDITAANISVIQTSHDPIKLAKQKHKIWNHAVVSVKENGQMYLFDPTCGQYSSKPTAITSKDPISAIVSQYVMSEKQFLVMNPETNPLNVNHQEEFNSIINSRPMSISTGEVEYLRNKAELIYKGNSHNQYQFFVTQEEHREEIEKMYKELCPHSDKPIKEWIIKK